MVHNLLILFGTDVAPTSDISSEVAYTSTGEARFLRVIPTSEASWFSRIWHTSSRNIACAVLAGYQVTQQIVQYDNL